MAITWRFRLTSGTAQIDFKSNRVKNWNAIKLSFQRNETLRGVLFQYSNVFEFTKEVRTFVRDVVDSGGIESELFLQMWVGNESGHRGSFKMLGSPLKATLGKTYTITDTTVTVTFSISGVEEMFLNRLDTEIEYDIEESIDGVNIGSPKYSEILLHDRIINGTAYWEFTNQSFEHTTNSPNVQTVIDNFMGTIKSTSMQGINSVYSRDHQTNFLYSNGNTLTKLNITITNLVVRIYSKILNVDLGQGSVQLWITDSLGAGIIKLMDYSVEPFNNYTSETLTINEVINAELQPFQFLQLRTYLQFRNKDIETEVGSGVGVDVTCDIPMVFTLESTFDPSFSKCILPLDAIERQYAKITGKQNAIISNFLGRKSLGYANDGEGAYLALMNGKLIRGFSTIDSKVTFKMKDLLKTFINGWNLVANFKDDRLVIEKFSDVYDINNSMKIEVVGKVKASLIESDHVANLKYGFKDFQLEEVNGLDDFIGVYERQTPIKSTDVKLDLVIPYLAGSYPIEFTRRKDYVHNPTEDYRSDKENFLIDSELNGATDATVKSKKGSPLQIDGILSPNTAYNIDLRPRKLLSNWFNVISSGLYQLPTKSIKFVKGANNTNLVVDGVSETSDIAINELGIPFFLPYFLEFKGKLTTDQFNELLLNANKVIEIGSTRLFGIIDEMEYDINTQEAEFKLIRANR